MKWPDGNLFINLINFNAVVVLNINIVIKSVCGIVFGPSYFDVSACLCGWPDEGLTNVD